MLDSVKRTGQVPVLVIFAPTACGKTELALSLFANDANSPFAGKAEVISADSMQVYKGLNVGTAKPDSDITSRLPHHLIDVNHPSVPFSVGDFVRMADNLCLQIFKRGKIPVVLGGTGFYIRNFLLGLPKTPESDDKLRFALKQRLEKEGSEVLYLELKKLDPESASRIHPNDHYRILRALEVCTSSGKPRSSFENNLKLRTDFKFCTIILHRERQELYQRINLRVEQMFRLGLPEEVENLVASGCTPDMPGMQAIGYREFFDNSLKLFNSKQERLDVIKQAICQNSRRYAKRQYTFVKGIPEATSFFAEDREGIEKYIFSNLLLT